MATYTKVYNNPYPDGWKDGKDGKTPVTADILNNQTATFESLEQYLADNPIEQGGGGTGGTTNYEELENLPSINGEELKGDITIDIPKKISDLEDDSEFLTDIKGQPYSDLSGKPTINGVEVVGDLTAEDLGLGGGGGGTTDYEKLNNLPSIENVELKGNITLAELGTKKQIRTSWTDYQALPTEEKNDFDVVYFVYDYPEGAITASNVVYDNETSGLKATEIQGAIDELNEKVTEGELKTASGTSIHIDNSKDAPCLVNTYGNTTQNGTPTSTTPIALGSTVISEIRTCRKNVLKNSATTQTIKGITFTVNENGSVTMNGTATERIDKNIGTFYCGTNIDYMVSIGSTGSGSTFALWSNVIGTIYNNKAFIVSENGTYNISLSVFAGANLNNVTIYPMIEVGTTATDYEPYTETVATLPEPITLNGLGDVKDYTDMKRGALVQKLAEITFDGSDDEKWQIKTDLKFNQFYISVPNALDSKDVICSHFSLIALSERETKTGFVSYNDNTFRFSLLLDLNITTTAQWKEWLASNPVTVVYKLAEPIITPLSEANIKALRALKSFDSITNVYNNASAEMDFMYATTDNAVINMENNNKFGDFITIVKAETNLDNASSGNFTTMLSEIIPSGYKLLGITNIYAKDMSGEIAGQIRVQANVQSVNYKNNTVMLNCNVYTGTSNPVSGTITFELLMTKR